MSNPFLGEIRMFGFTFAPQGWALCNGQTLAISQNTALFSLLGTTYGGNGQTTFQLPNLQSRVAVHFGQGPGLSQYVQGQTGGLENVTLTVNQMPAHNHLVNATSSAATVNGPGTRFLGHVQAGAPPIYAATTNDTMAPTMISVAGSSQPHTNIQPYLVLNFCIALAGLFPSRN
jgi:microcystin-dependent protein